MRYLLDTHAFLWWLADDRRLGDEARAWLSAEDSVVFVSAVSIWEIAIKVKIGKLEFDGDPLEELKANEFIEMPVSGRHAWAAGALPRHHDDPFDRMLVAQSLHEGLRLVTRDHAMAAYGVPVLID